MTAKEMWKKVRDGNPEFPEDVDIEVLNIAIAKAQKLVKWIGFFREHLN